MRKTFIRVLIVNAAVQFVITRQRAGNVLEEGAAEALWVRYPFMVLLNSLLWTLMLSGIGRVLGVFRLR